MNSTVYVECCERMVSERDAVAFWYDPTNRGLGRVYLCKVDSGCTLAVAL